MLLGYFINDQILGKMFTSLTPCFCNSLEGSSVLVRYRPRLESVRPRSRMSLGVFHVIFHWLLGVTKGPTSPSGPHPDRTPDPRTSRDESDGNPDLDSRRDPLTQGVVRPMSGRHRRVRGVDRDQGKVPFPLTPTGVLRSNTPGSRTRFGRSRVGCGFEP